MSLENYAMKILKKEWNANTRRKDQDKKEQIAFQNFQAEARLQGYTDEAYIKWAWGEARHKHWSSNIRNISINTIGATVLLLIVFGWAVALFVSIMKITIARH